MDSLGRMITILLAVILVVILPLQYIAEAQVEIMDHVVEAHTHDFADTVRNEGHISLENYEEYRYRLNQTGEFYDIQIEHASPRTVREIIAENTNSGTLLVFNDTTRLLEADALITSLATHTHTDACYDGHRHTESGCYYRSGHSHSSSCYHSHSSSCYTTCNGSYTTQISSSSHYCGGTYKTYRKVCSSCGGVGSITTTCSGYKPSDPNNTCSGGYNTGGGGHKKTLTCATSTSSPICGKSSGPGGWSCGKSQDTSSICNTVVTNITATHPSQTVYTGDNIVTTATATYLDGHTGMVNCTTTGYDNTTPGTQRVTLTYSGKVGNAKTTGARTCTTTIRVKGRLQSIRVTPSVTTVYNGTEPTYTVKAIYGDGTQRTLTSSQYTKTGWSGGVGKKTVTFQYTEFGKTVTTSVTITVEPNITSIAVAPSTQAIERYQEPSFDVHVNYEDGTSTTTSSYVIKNFNNQILGTQTVTITYTENNITKNTTAVVTVNNLLKTCPKCGNQYELDDNDIDHGCPICTSTVTGIDATPDYITVMQGSALTISVFALYRDGGRAVVHEWSSDYDPLRIGFQQVTIAYNGFKDYVTVEVKVSQRTCPICENEYRLNEDGSDPGCPICSNTVVDIVAEPNPITTAIHKSLDLTVTATFKDGHTEVVDGWSTDFVPDKPGTFKVTVFYKTVADQITVTILDDDLSECPYCGMTFRRSRYPNGCPTCSITVIGIEADLRNGGTKVIRGTDLALEIILIFRDTHREVTYTGYTVSNYQPDLLGEQSVIVHYNEFLHNMTIEVIDSLTIKICPNGHEYHLNEDGSDPGCPYCLNENDREQTAVYYDITYTPQIIETLYYQKAYQMKAGDYITVIVTKKNKSLRSQIRNLFRESKEENKTITCGGEIFG